VGTNGLLDSDDNLWQFIYSAMKLFSFQDSKQARKGLDVPNAVIGITDGGGIVLVMVGIKGIGSFTLRPKIGCFAQYCSLLSRLPWLHWDRTQVVVVVLNINAKCSIWNLDAAGIECPISDLPSWWQTLVVVADNCRVMMMMMIPCSNHWPHHHGGIVEEQQHDKWVDGRQK
jgi:hypothetical protein